MLLPPGIDETSVKTMTDEEALALLAPVYPEPEAAQFVLDQLRGRGEPPSVPVS